MRRNGGRRSARYPASRSYPIHGTGNATARTELPAQVGLEILYAKPGPRDELAVGARYLAKELRERFWIRAAGDAGTGPRTWAAVGMTLHWPLERVTMGRHRNAPGDAFRYVFRTGTGGTESRADWFEVTEVFEGARDGCRIVHARPQRRSGCSRIRPGELRNWTESRHSWTCGTAAGAVDRRDACRQLAVALRARRPAAPQPRVVTAARHPQHPAHRRHPVFGLVRLHEREDLPGTVSVSRANQAAASFSPDNSVRRAKVHGPSGCESHPARVVPAGSNRNGRGGNEAVEASEEKGP